MTKYVHVGALNHHSWQFFRDWKRSVCNQNRWRCVSTNISRTPTLWQLPTYKAIKKIFSLCSDEADGVSPAEKLSPQHLQHLRNAFTATLDSKAVATNRVRSGINLKEFDQVLRSIMGPRIDQTWVKKFFDEVNEAQTETLVMWDEWYRTNVNTLTCRWTTAVPDRWAGRMCVPTCF